MFVFGGYCEGEEGNENQFNDRASCMEICTGNYTDDDIRNGVIISSRNTAPGNTNANFSIRLIIVSHVINNSIYRYLT